MSKRTCRVVKPPKTDACGSEEVTHKVTFKDDDTVLSCEDCAVFLRDTARGFGTAVKIERLS